MNRWARLVPLTGLIAIALFVAAVIVGGEPPDFDETGQKVLSFYREDESAQLASSILGAYGAVFLIFFFGALRSALRRGPGTEGLAAVAFGGGLIMALGLLIFAGFSFTLADAADALEPAAAQTLNALNGDFFFPAAGGGSALLLASGIAIVRGAPLPSWLGWVAIVLGVLALTPAGFFAFLGSGLWIAVTAVLLVVRPPGGEPGAARGTLPS